MEENGECNVIRSKEGFSVLGKQCIAKCVSVFPKRLIMIKPLGSTVRSFEKAVLL